MPNLKTIEVIPDGFALSQGIEMAAERGYAFVPQAIASPVLALLEEEAANLPLELGDHVTSPIHKGELNEITQLHERGYYAISDKAVPVARMATKALAVHIRSLRYRHQGLHEWLAAEAGYQLYRNPDHHISKHRDRNNDRLLAATITIRGAAIIGIHETLDDPNDYTNTQQIDEYRAEAGTVMFLRAPGLGSGEQVIHDVSGPIGGSRLILNLRQRPNILPSPSELAAG